MHITQRLNIAGIDVALRNFGQRLQLGLLCLGQGRQLALFVPNRFHRMRVSSASALIVSHLKKSVICAPCLNLAQGHTAQARLPMA